jgi:hypothetical protein
MKILVCDRCGFELTEKDDINLVVEGSESWKTAVREKGVEPRGVYPCKNYIRCQGEMLFQEKKKKGLFQR